MDEIAPNSQSPAVRIIVDPGKPDECTNNGSSDENKSSEVDSKAETISSAVDKSVKEAVAGGETARDPGSRLFLRPSALTRDGFRVTPLVATNSSLSKISSSNNKFACPDEPVEPVFNIPPKSEKVDAVASLTAPKMPVAVSLSNPNYVFGQNIGERVTERVDSVSNGTGTMLFTSALSAESSKKTSESEAESKEGSSLLEDAARCQEQRAAKRKYEEVQVTTGEEDEKNVIQITVKLFAFEGGSWVERGRGTLRLNDGGSGGSRIVVRTLGNFRVVLNTKIWAGMELSRASQRSIRTTAMDATGTLKIFLIQASPADITTLYNLMESRVKRCKASGEPDSGKLDTEEVAKEEDKEESPRSPKVAVLEESS